MKNYFNTRLKNQIKYTSLLLFVYICLLPIDSLAQGRGTIKGKVIDSETGDILPGATVRVSGTTTGVISDIYGKYTLDLPSGEYQIEVSFIGYENAQVFVTIEAGKTETVDIEMRLDVLMTEEVVITGQALGQMGAINQQINANSIVNVVSKDKIRELPDQNAAETVGRLPGVSVQRDAGEGQKVVVRGLSPRFNSITVNGERIPSTDLSDRSVDLSMISSDVLEGIEVYKALTPDRDGDAVGGTVNFITKEAPDEQTLSLRVQTGYNDLAGEFGQWRGNGSWSKRFFEGKFGLILSGNYQRANRSKDTYNASVSGTGVPTSTGELDFRFENLNLSQSFEKRLRYGGSAAFDVRLPNGGITYNLLYGATDRELDRYRTRFRVGSGRMEYDLSIREQSTSLITNTFQGNHTIANKLLVEWRSSFSSSNLDIPFNHYARFRDQGGTELEDTEDQIVQRAYELLSLDRTYLHDVRNDLDQVTTNNLTGQVDLRLPYGNSIINGYLKVGGKVRIESRERDVTRFWIPNGTPGSVVPDEVYIRDSNDRISIYNFIAPIEDNGYTPNDYYFGLGTPDTLPGQHIDKAGVLEYYNTYGDNYSRQAVVDLGDYDTEDQITAGYVMVNANLLNGKVNIVGGARYENTSLTYTGFDGSGASGDDEEFETSVTEVTESRSYGELLPMVNMKIKPMDWFDVRLAVTRTLNRPNFFNLVPWERRNNFEGSIERGFFDLQHSVAMNYDAFLSFYGKFGLITVGGFYKDLENVDFIQQSAIQVDQGGSLAIFDLITPTNTFTNTEVRGVEFDFQTNFRYLPSPWDGIVLSANASFLDTKAFYPFSEIVRDPTRIVDTEREGDLVGQPSQIYNISLGYEKQGFSGRISLLHQGTALGVNSGGGSDRPGGYNVDVGKSPGRDRFSIGTTRLDMTLKQRITNNFKIFFNWNNITNQEESEKNGGDIVERIEFYGYTMDLGLQFTLN